MNTRLRSQTGAAETEINMFKFAMATVAGLAATLCAANAATLTYIESARSDAGTPNAGEITPHLPGFDLTSALTTGALTSDDQVDLFFFLNTGKDTVTFTATSAVDIVLQSLHSCGSGQLFSMELFGDDTGVITLPMNAITPQVVWSLLPGTYSMRFDIVGGSRNTWIDMSFVGADPVPLPGAAVLFVTALAAGGAARRRAQRA